MFKQIIIFLLLFNFSSAQMNCTVFNDFDEFGGHWYSVTRTKFTYAEAKKYAEENGGILAIPDNGEENTFLAKTLRRDSAWIGIYDPAFIANKCFVEDTTCSNDDTRFRTVKGEFPAFKNWKSGEPNNAVYHSDFLNDKEMVSPSGEYWVVMQGATGKWEDMGNHVEGGNERVIFQALIEFETMPECAVAPTDYADSFGLIGSGEEGVCDTTVSDAVFSEHIPHQTMNCQVDNLQNPYCPYKTSSCNKGYLYSQGSSKQKHEGNYTYYEYSCEKGQEVVDKGGDCGGNNLIDTDGDGIGDSCNRSTPPEKNCKTEHYFCPYNEDRGCSLVNNHWQCSPYPCFGKGEIKNEDTVTSLTDKDNSGWREDGTCNGQIYIFNGKDQRCRSKIFFDILNDCCKHDSFLFGLVECKDKELVLDRRREDERCHYLGSYCSTRMLGACVQEKKTYCCYGSKLSRIIVEAGRDQIPGLDFGTPKHPKCRGFTPDEFEKIDFSKIDLSEFTKGLEGQMDASNLENVSTRLQDKIKAMQGKY